MVDDSKESERDRKIVDSGWGVKADDQPANTHEVGADATRVFHYSPSELQVVRKILQTQRRNFNTANRVRIEPGRVVISDINKDEFVVAGLSYGDENLIELLMNLGAAFSPQELAALGRSETGTREYALSRAWAWGAERTG